MPDARTILDQLPRNDLIALADRHGLAVADRRVRAQLLDALVASPALRIGEVLAERSRDELKALCRAFGLDDGGREKAALIARLTDGQQLGLPLAPAPATPVRPPAPPASSPVQPRGSRAMNDLPPPPSPADAPSSARAPRRFESFGELSGFIFSIADRLRGKYRPSEYAKVVLPMTVIRRFDCVLDARRDEVRRTYDAHRARKKSHEEAERDTLDDLDLPFINTSRLSLTTLGHDTVARDLVEYLNGFSLGAREVLDNFRFAEQIDRLHKAELLGQIVGEFAAIDLHPDRVDNHTMGSAFEDLIRRFSEQSNEKPGEHYTPRDVVQLMADLVLAGDDARLATPGFAPSLYDPACGTGGMLSVADERIRARNPRAKPNLFGQELNDESFAICKGDMMLREQDPSAIAHGNSFTQDGHAGKRFDYMLSNPPFGVDWKNIEDRLRRRQKAEGADGPFAAGLPRVSDGSLLFLQHMVAKMKPAQGAGGGSRIGVVFNGSPLFTGDAGSGESEIRRWLLENDLVEAIVALPDQLFFNTGISTYVWLVTNRKSPAREGKVQLIDGSGCFHKMRRSLGDKRNELTKDDRDAVLALHAAFAEAPKSKVFDNRDFGYTRVVVERPLRMNYATAPERVARIADETAFRNLVEKPGRGSDAAAGRATQDAIRKALGSLDMAAVHRSWGAFADVLGPALTAAGVKLTGPLRAALRSALGERDETAEPVRDEDGNVVPDAELRDYENVPLKEDVEAYFRREVLPHVPDAWLDRSKDRVGYEIPFTRHFYEYKPLRPLGEIEGDLDRLTREIQALMRSPRSAAAYVVTKGLDRDVQMKDSGIPWIGEIPAHWDVQPLGRSVESLCDGPFGSDMKSSHYVDMPGVRVVRLQNIGEGIFEDEDKAYISEEHFQSLAGHDALPGDLLIAGLGDENHPVGRACILPDHIPVAMVKADCFRVRCRAGSLLHAFIAQYLSSAPARAEVAFYQRGSTRARMNLRGVVQIRVPVPPVPEQQRIVEYIRESSARVLRLRDQLQQQVVSLREYRQALITEAVTGRIPLSAMAAP